VLSFLALMSQNVSCRKTRGKFIFTNGGNMCAACRLRTFVLDLALLHRPRRGVIVAQSRAA